MFVLALFSVVPSLDSHAVCKTCEIRSTREDSPAFCDDLHQNVCKKIENESPVLGASKNSLTNLPAGLSAVLKAGSKSEPPAKGSFDTDPGASDYVVRIIEPGYAKFMASHGVSTYRDFSKKVLGTDYKINTEEASEADWKVFFTRSVDDKTYKKLFPEYGACTKMLKDFSDVLYDKKKSDLQEMKSLRVKIIDFREKSRQQLIRYHARHVRAFSEKFVAEMCKNRKDDLDPQASTKCAEYSTLRKEIIEWTALDASESEKQKLAEQLVKRWLIVPKEWDERHVPKSVNSVSSVENSNALLYYSASEICENLNTAFKYGLNQKEYEIYQDRFLPSKVFVDHTFDSFITDVRQEKIKELGNEVRKNFRKKLSTMKCAPQTEIDKALEDLNALEISPFKRPTQSSYEKNSYGEMVLKKPAWGDATPIEYDTFATGNPRVFKNTNGYFTPQRGGRPARITICGDLYENAELSSKDTKLLFAHEFGHLLDSDNALKFYPSMIACYKKLRSCLEPMSKDQVRDDQMAESISDVYAAEFMSDELNQIPMENRRTELQKYMKTMCLFEKESTDKFTNFSDDSHADEIVRMNYLTGGNKKLRETLGCSLESKTVPVCELNLGGDKL